LRVDVTKTEAIIMFTVDHINELRAELAAPIAEREAACCVALNREIRANSAISLPKS
jgi:hypothetical protein